MAKFEVKLNYVRDVVKTVYVEAYTAPQAVVKAYYTYCSVDDVRNMLMSVDNLREKVNVSCGNYSETDEPFDPSEPPAGIGLSEGYNRKIVEVEEDHRIRSLRHEGWNFIPAHSLETTITCTRYAEKNVVVEADDEEDAMDVAFLKYGGADYVGDIFEYNITDAEIEDDVDISCYDGEESASVYNTPYDLHNRPKALEIDVGSRGLITVTLEDVNKEAEEYHKYYSEDDNDDYHGYVEEIESPTWE